MAGVTIRKRLNEWWREPGEVADEGKLNEAYDPSRLKPGYDGKNGPDVKKMYATDADGSPGGLGSGKKTSKGSSDPKSPSTTESKKKNSVRVKEEFETDEMDDDLDPSMIDDEFEMEGEGEVNPEADMPPEIDDVGGDESLVDDIEITVGSQRYVLVPAETSDMESPEGEMDVPVEGDVSAEMDDVTAPEDDDAFDLDKKPQMESTKSKKLNIYNKMIDEALAKKSKPNSKETTQRVARALSMIEKAQKELHELFNGDYVQNKGEQASAGKDFSSVRGDTNFAVVARAATGKQYTPSSSDGDQEPSKKEESRPSKSTEFKKWLETQKKKIEETDSDPGQDSDEFNKKDTIENNLGNVEDFPQIPEIIGSDPQTISQYAKTAEARKARKTKVQESEQPVQYPSEKVKAEIEQSLEESFNFAEFLKGKYK